MLKTIADDLGQAAVSGNLSQSIGFNVSSLGVIPPPPASSDPSWREVNYMEFCFVNSIVRSSVFHECSLVQWFPAVEFQEASVEVTREEPEVSFVSSVSSLLLLVEPVAGEYVGPLSQQPRLMAVDEMVRQ